MNVVQFIDYFYNALVDPEKLSQTIADGDKKHFIMGGFVVAVIVFVDIVSQSLLAIQTGFFLHKITYGFIALFLIHVMFIVLYAGLLTVVLHLAGYQASGSFIIHTLALSQIPRIFILPVVLIFTSLYFAPVFFYSAASLGLMIWSMLIAMRCISQRYSIDAFRSAGFLLAPAVVMGVMILLISVAGIMVFAGLFQ